MVGAEMSRYVAALVYRKRLGSMARKSILAYCAERANDDGTGIWASKVTIAKEVECSKQTVISTLRDLVADGILREVGKRKCQNGFVVEYDIVVSAVEALEDAISRAESTGPILDRSNELTPRGQTTLPQEVKPVDPNRPRTVLKPSIAPKPPEGASDLFSEIEDDQTQKTDSIEESFEEFWKQWPSGSRKAGKVDCRKVYRKACTGKHEKADKIEPAVLNRAARLYVEDLRRAGKMEFIQGPLPWLRKPGWEPFLEAAQRAGSIGRQDRVNDLLRQYGTAPSADEIEKRLARPDPDRDARVAENLRRLGIGGRP